MNKENISKYINTSRTKTSHHPSQQSRANLYRPSIKVGYKVIPCVESQQKRAKRKIQPNYNLMEKINCKKMNEEAKVQKSGKFVNSEYIKQQQKIQPFFSKKGVAECRDKYQTGESVKQNMVSQSRNNSSRRSSSVASITNSRTSRNQLPSYQKTGIKDIMEYHHALPYRERPVTQKCTSSNALSRFFKFEDLHQYDFRKRPEFLR